MFGSCAYHQNTSFKKTPATKTTVLFSLNSPWRNLYISRTVCSHSPRNSLSNSTNSSDFNPKTLTVAQLRGVLNENAIHYASNAKKAELLALFHSEIKPNATKLLKEDTDAVNNPNDDGLISTLGKKPATNDLKKRQTRRSRRSESALLGDDSDVEMLSSTEAQGSAQGSVQGSAKALKKTLEILDIDDEESNVSNETVLQTANTSAETEKVSRKRKLPADSDSVKAKRKSSKKPKKLDPETTPKPLEEVSNQSPRSASRPSKKSPKIESKGNVFGVETADDFGTPMIINKVSNIINSPKKSTPVKRTLANTSSNESSWVSSKHTTPKKDTPVKSPLIKSSPRQHIPSSTRKSAKSTPHKSFETADEEAADFDKSLRKIRPKKRASTAEADETTDFTSRKPTLPIKLDLGLEAQLGINVQGIPPQVLRTPLKKPKKVLSNAPEKVESDEELDDENDEAETTTESTIRATNFKRSPIHAISFILIWLSILLLGMFTYWYREQTFLVGFCGHEINQPTIPSNNNTPQLLVQLGSYLDNNFKPKCVKCPPHARCFNNLELACFEDFIEYTPWYFNYLPVVDPNAKKCIPDTKKAEKLEIMIDVALDLLRTKNANKNCGNTPESRLDAGLQITELHDLLLMIKAPYITEEEFEELWQRSIVELEKEPEIIVRQVGFFEWDVSLIFDIILTSRRDLQHITYLPQLTLTTHLQRRKPRTKFFDQRPYRSLA